MEGGGRGRPLSRAPLVRRLRHTDARPLTMRLSGYAIKSTVSPNRPLPLSCCRDEVYAGPAPKTPLYAARLIRILPSIVRPLDEAAYAPAQGSPKGRRRVHSPRLERAGRRWEAPPQQFLLFAVRPLASARDVATRGRPRVCINSRRSVLLRGTAVSFHNYSIMTPRKNRFNFSAVMV